MLHLRLTFLFVAACLSSAVPSPEEIEKLVCEFASQKQIEDKATAEICSVITQKIHIPDCPAAVEMVWDKVLAMCPKGKSVPMPSPEEIEKLVCEFASQKQIEDKATAEICSVITQKIHIPDCPAAVEMVWDKVLAMCPKGKAVTMPSPEEIEKLVCEFASQKQIEDKATAEICSVITQKIHIPDCPAAVEMVWDKVLAMCPKGKAVTMPSPEEIEKLVCEFASQKQIEDKATAEICSVITQKIHIPDCPAAVEMVWDKVLTMCPKGKAVTMPSPEEIEKLVCEFASQKQIEDKATAEICSVITQKIHIPDCPAAVEMVWDKVLAMCPKGKESVIVV